MKLVTLKNPALAMIGVVLGLFMLLSSSVSLGANEGTAITPDEIVAELKPKLGLNDQQIKDLTASLTELSKKLDGLIAKQAAATEGGDPNEFISGIKQAQADYQKELKKILTSAQLQSYNALREQVIMDAMKNLAEIRLLDIQPQVKFSDDQMNKLVPVVAESMRSFMKIAWEYAGKRLRLGEKIRVARDLKKIQSDAQ
ncbi:MAG TPA: hypothetical protein VIJ25_15165, partial [Methylococcales bacterium]